MAVGDALSKFWTYGNIEDAARLRTGTLGDTQITPALALDLIAFNTQKIAKRIVDSGGSYADKYLTTTSTLTITGTANPYTVDMSSLAPFLDKPARVVHVTTGGTRTLVKIVSQEEAEQTTSLTNAYASAIFGAWEGDVLRLYKGASFTITIGSDTVEMKYFREPKLGSTSATTIVSDTTFTIGADFVTITGFTGVLASHIGGLFVGTDHTGTGFFARTISQYVSSTSFIVSSAIGTTGVEGSATNGYIIPPSTNSVTKTRGTYVDIPDTFADLLVNLTAADFARHKNGGTPDVSLDQSNIAQLNAIYDMSARETAQEKK